MSSGRTSFVWIVFLTVVAGVGCQQPARPAPAKPGTPARPSATPAAEPKAEEPKAEAAKPPPVAPKTEPAASQPRPSPVLTPPTSQPEKSATTHKAEQPDEEARRLAEIAQLLAERKPKRPTPSWVIFREAFEESKDATCDAEWTGESRLEVHTDNIKKLTLDLTKLPAAAPHRGPWNLQIDHQGIQITGRRGKVLDLIRSKNGNWSVDHSKDK